MFRDLLVHTNMERDISYHNTLTVLVLDNSMMGPIYSMPWAQTRDVLATHVILDYLDQNRLDKLRDNSVVVTTLYQTYGFATDQEGLLNITVSNSGDVVFGSAVQGAPRSSRMVKTVVVEPYISVIQISQPIMTPGLFLPSPSPSSSSNPIASPNPSSSSSSTPPSPISAPEQNEPAASPTIKAIDIGQILDGYQEFRMFKDLLIHTNVEKDINCRRALTILVLGNSEMGPISSMPWAQSRDILATHVILHYFDQNMLGGLRDNSAIVTTLFKTYGTAIDQQGLLNITVFDSGDVVFGSAVQGAAHVSRMVKTVVAEPYVISVIQISQPIMTPGLFLASPSPSSSSNPSASPTSPVLAPAPNGGPVAGPTISGIDISNILDDYDEFKMFKDLLIYTDVEKDINSGHTLTVRVLDNSMMGTINSMPLAQSKGILATHVILGYFDSNMLSALRDNSVIVTTLFQTYGTAVDQQGLLNVTVSDNGDVTFGSAVQGASHASRMLKTVAANPYEISVIQISQPIIAPGLFPPSSPPSSSSNPTPTPSPNPSSSLVPSPTSRVLAPAPSAHYAGPTPAPAPAPAPENEGNLLPTTGDNEGEADKL